MQHGLIDIEYFMGIQGKHPMIWYSISNWVHYMKCNMYIKITIRDLDYNIIE